MVKPASKSSGRLGERIATKAHKEGRKAYRDGLSQHANPYNSKAVRDSDEWLRHQNWHNGWNFADTVYPDTKGKQGR